jgi:hypothetical protein
MEESRGVYTGSERERERAAATAKGRIGRMIVME